MKNVTIAGRLTRDSKLNRTKSGDPVLSFPVAVNDPMNKARPTEYFDCSMWGERGGKLEQYLVKGGSVTVNGDLGRREHEGQTYFTIRVDSVTLQGGGQKAEAEPAPARQAPGAMAAAMDDDIPFNMEWR